MLIFMCVCIHTYIYIYQSLSELASSSSLKPILPCSASRKKLWQPSYPCLNNPHRYWERSAGSLENRQNYLLFLQLWVPAWKPTFSCIMNASETEVLRATGWPKVNVDKWQEQILSEKASILLHKAAKQLYATNWNWFSKCRDTVWKPELSLFLWFSLPNLSHHLILIRWSQKTELAVRLIDISLMSGIPFVKEESPSNGSLAQPSWRMAMIKVTWGLCPLQASIPAQTQALSHGSLLTPWRGFDSSVDNPLVSLLPRTELRI